MPCPYPVSTGVYPPKVDLNIAFMWYLGYDLDEPTSNHSVISKARARYRKEVFEQFFQRVLELCVKVGLVGGEKVFVDSTLIKANASLKSLVSRKDVMEPKFSPKEYVERVFSENSVETDPSNQDLKEAEELKLIKALRRIRRASLLVKKKRRGKANKGLVSTTDLEAILLCHRLGLDYVSCSPFRVPIARLAAARQPWER